MAMTDDEAVRLLKGIRHTALCMYPFPDDSKISPRFAMTFGQIAGLASKAMVLEKADAILRPGDMSMDQLKHELEELGHEMNSWTQAAGIANKYLTDIEAELEHRRFTDTLPPWEEKQ